MLGTALAFDPPKPNPYLEKQLAQEGITHQEWLLFDGIGKNNIEQVAYALSEGADPNEARDVVTQFPPLIAAVTRGSSNEAIVTLLIEKGAQVNGRYTPKPFKPKESDLLSRMQTMVMNESLVGARTPLHYAAFLGVPQIIALLISRGADLEAKNNQGQTPLFEVPSDKRENAEALLNARAQINAREKSGKTVLWYKRWWYENVRELREHQKQKLKAYIEWLVEKGATE